MRTRAFVLLLKSMGNSQSLSLKQPELPRQCTHHHACLTALAWEDEMLLWMGLLVGSFRISKLWLHDHRLESLQFCDLLLTMAAQNESLGKNQGLATFLISSISDNHFIEKIAPFWEVPPLTWCWLPVEGEITTITNLILAVTPELTLWRNLDYVWVCYLCKETSCLQNCFWGPIMSLWNCS